MTEVDSTLKTLTEHEQKTGYLQEIRGILDLNFTPGHNETQIVSFVPIGDWFLVNIYADWGEWFQSWRIMYDLEQWLKDTIFFQREVIGDEATRATYITDVNRLLDTWGPDNWAERVPQEVALEWITIFKAQEIAEVAQAKAELTTIKNKKLIGFGIIGAFGLFGLSFLLSKKK